MELNELKPNFERIVTLLGTPINPRMKKLYNLQDKLKKADSKGSVKEPLLSLKTRELFELWESLERKEISYSINDSITLKALLEEFDLEPFYNDFLFLSLNFIKWNKKTDRMNESFTSGREDLNELVSALAFLYEYDLKDISLVVKHRKENNSTSITHKEIIKAIRAFMINWYYSNYKETWFFERLSTHGNPDFFAFKGNWNLPDSEDIQFWQNFFNDEGMLKIQEKKGRKKKHLLTGKIIDSLQIYLQDYTELKAEEGIAISRKQASFIYKFLKIFNLIEDQLSWEEDNIRHILDKFRNPKPETITLVKINKKK